MQYGRTLYVSSYVFTIVFNTSANAIAFATGGATSVTTLKTAFVQQCPFVWASDLTASVGSASTTNVQVTVKSSATPYTESAAIDACAASFTKMTRRSLQQGRFAATLSVNATGVTDVRSLTTTRSAVFQVLVETTTLSTAAMTALVISGSTFTDPIAQARGHTAILDHARPRKLCTTL